MKTIRDLCKEYGYSQTKLAKRFGIPLRTVQNWHGGQREPAPYVVPMMEEILRLEKAGGAERKQSAVWTPLAADGYADGAPVYYLWECSNCHEEFNSDGEPPMHNYCPNCGAEMKEV